MFTDLKYIEENIPKEIEHEILTLYDLGASLEEIEYLIYIKKEKKGK